MGSSTFNNFLVLGSFSWENNPYVIYKIKSSTLEALENDMANSLHNKNVDSSIMEKNHYLLKIAFSISNDYVLYNLKSGLDFKNTTLNELDISPSYVNSMIDKYEFYKEKNDTVKSGIIITNISKLYEIIDNKYKVTKTKIWGANGSISANNKIDNPGEKYFTNNLPQWSKETYLDPYSESPNIAGR